VRAAAEPLERETLVWLDQEGRRQAEAAVSPEQAAAPA
jgi:hypothetical protein